MTKIKVRQRVGDVSPFYDTVEEYIKRLRDVVKYIPEQYDKNSVVLDMQQDDYSDSYSVVMLAEREETDAEYNQRMKAQQDREAYERRQYEQLKAKYGD